MHHANRLLVLAPHTDDAELGCGGAIARFLEAGTEVYVVAFSTADESLPPDVPPSTLADEFSQAMEILGISKHNTIIHRYPVRRLSYYRQEVLEAIVQLRRKIQPDLIFLPASSDLHQDHQVVHLEGLRAFKDCTVLGYELPWNHLTFDTQAFVRLEERHLKAKWNALQAYKSQFNLGRPYFSWEFIEGLARVRGVQVRAEYAEAFQVMRLNW